MNCIEGKKKDKVLIKGYGRKKCETILIWWVIWCTYTTVSNKFMNYLKKIRSDVSYLVVSKVWSNVQCSGSNLVYWALSPTPCVFLSHFFNLFIYLLSFFLPIFYYTWILLYLKPVLQQSYYLCYRHAMLPT